MQRANIKHECISAANALRRYMQDQQFILRRRLAPHVEKAFMMMDADHHQSN